MTDKKELTNEDVFDAVLRGDIDGIDEATMSEAACCYAIGGRGGRSLLHAAAENGSLVVFRRVLDDYPYRLLDENNPLGDWVEYVESSHVDDVGQTPLHVACRLGHREVAEELVSNGASPTRDDNLGMTPLHYAEEAGANDLVKILLDGLKLDHPLCFAAEHGQVGFVRWLLAHGADVRENDGRDLWPLDLAIAEHRKGVVPLLLAADAWVFPSGGPLHVAAKRGDLDMCRLLVEHGVRINYWDNANWAPLHWAIADGYSDVVRFLLEKGGDPNDWATRLVGGYWPLSPLYMAVQTRKRESVAALLDHGADPNDGRKGFTTIYQMPTGVHPGPLHLAAELGDVEIVDLLLRHGARCDVPDGNGATPLHIAVSRRDEAIVRLLIAAGADPTARNKNNETPYALAMRAGQTGVARLVRISPFASIRALFGSAMNRLTKAVRRLR